MNNTEPEQVTEPTAHTARALKARGLTTFEISRDLDISVSCVQLALNNNTPTRRHKRRSDAGGGSYTAKTCKCGAAHRPTAAQCRTCMNHDRAETAISADAARIDTLVRHAAMTGYIPTTDEAKDLLGTARTKAGDLVLAAFGRDKRLGFDRRGSKRSYKPE